MLFFVQRLQQANAAGDNYCMFSGGVGRDQRRQGFDPFLCVWFWQGFVPGHTCVLAVHTRTHLSLSTESQWPDTYGWHCAETMPLVRLPCAGHLLFILSLCLLVPQQNRGPTGTAKKCLRPLIHGVLHGLQKLQGLNP